MSDLKDRGLKGQNLEVMVSDGAGGLIKAFSALYPRVTQQLCPFHKVNNLDLHLSNRAHRSRIISSALGGFEGDTVTEVRGRLKIFCKKRWSKEPKAVRNFIRGFENCLPYLDYPEPIRTMLKTNNPIERYLQELRRRIIPMRAFNNSKSIERIIYGLIAYVLNQQQDVPQQQIHIEIAEKTVKIEDTIGRERFHRPVKPGKNHPWRRRLNWNIVVKKEDACILTK